MLLFFQRFFKTCCKENATDRQGGGEESIESNFIKFFFKRTQRNFEASNQTHSFLNKTSVK